jgi:hypothetical protein
MRTKARRPPLPLLLQVLALVATALADRAPPAVLRATLQEVTVTADPFGRPVANRRFADYERAHTSLPLGARGGADTYTAAIVRAKFDQELFVHCGNASAAKPSLSVAVRDLPSPRLLLGERAAIGGP